MALHWSDRIKDLLTREKKAFAVLAIVRSDGTAQATPVWFDFDGTSIIINTARGRVKDRILHKNRTATVVVLDPANSYNYVQLSGPVAVETEEGGQAQIEDLAEKYTGKRAYDTAPGDVRVTYKIKVERIQPAE